MQNIAQFIFKCLTLIFIFTNLSVGQKWSYLDIDSYSNGSILRGIYFTSIMEGIVVGDQGVILKTTDGGVNWVKIPSGTTKNLSAISFYNQNNGIIVGDEIIIKTSDGGASWVEQLSIPPYNLKSISYIDSNLIISVGGNSNDGIILRTTDNGLNWDRINVGNIPTLTKVAFSDYQKGIAVGYNSIVLGTTDGGLSWQKRKENANWHTPAAVAFHKNIGIVVLDQLFYRTTNGGSTWSDSGALPFSCLDVVFSDSLNATVVGYGGIASSTNGGLSWEYSGRINAIMYSVFSTGNNEISSVGNILSQNFFIRSSDKRWPPQKPSLMSPDNNGTHIKLEVSYKLPFGFKFGWKRYAPFLSLHYHFQIASDSLFTINNKEFTSPLYYEYLPVGGLLPNSIYYWRVRADYDLATSGWSNIWKFSTGVDSSHITTIEQIQKVPLESLMIADSLQNATAFNLQRSSFADNITLLINVVCIASPQIFLQNNNSHLYKMVVYDTTKGLKPWNGIWIKTYNEDTTFKDAGDNILDVKQGDIISVIGNVMEDYDSLNPISNSNTVINCYSLKIMSNKTNININIKPFEKKITDFYNGKQMYSLGESYEGMYVTLRDLTVHSIVSGRTGKFTMTDGGGNVMSTSNESRWFSLSPELHDPQSNYTLPVPGTHIDSITGVITANDSGYCIAPIYPSDLKISEGSSYIRGMAYFDKNKNSIMDGKDVPLKNWQVSIGGKAQATLLTDSYGIFSTIGIDSGSYFIFQAPPKGWSQTYPDYNQYNILLMNHDTVNGIVFGSYTNSGCIKGIVFKDDNLNGTYENYEDGLYNWRIDYSGKIIGNTGSDINGKYHLAGLDSGVYIISEQPQLGWIRTIPSTDSYIINLGINDTVQSANFGYHFNGASITGKVYNDLNENGQQDSNEAGLSHWQILRKGLSSDEVLTDATGNFIFSGIEMGKNNVNVSIPFLWEQIFPRYKKGYEIGVAEFKNYTGLEFGVHLIPPRVKISIFVTAKNISNSVELMFGERPGAHYGIWGVDSTCSNIDYSEGEDEYPPVLQGMFDARFIDPKLTELKFGNGSVVDIRDYLSASQIDTFKIIFSPGYFNGGNYPMIFHWSKDSIKNSFSGSVILKNPSYGIFDMKSIDSLEVTDSTISAFILIAQGPNLVRTDNKELLVPVPQEFALSQNYPNPFNPSTRIDYALPCRAYVIINVFNLLGQKIKTLVDSKQEAGYKSVVFQADDIPSGIYFYKINAVSIDNPQSTFTLTRKTLFIR